MFTHPPRPRPLVKKSFNNEGKKTTRVTATITSTNVMGLLHVMHVEAVKVLLVLACLTSRAQTTNLLQNPSFEDGYTGWSTRGYKQSLHSEDKVHGTYSLKVAERKTVNTGPFQENVTFINGRHYEFEGYVKMLNDVEGTIWQHLKAVIEVYFTDGTDQSYNIAYRSFCRTSDGWIRLKGDIEAPMKEMTKQNRLMIRGLAQEVDFLLDNLTFRELPEDPDWRLKADQNIENHRKSNVTITVNLPDGVPASEVSVEVSLKKHKFAFGSLISHEDVVADPQPEVMRIFYSWFEWATIQNYKWKFMKGNPLNNPDMRRAIDSTKELRSYGISVRAHSIFWNVDKNIPEEVLKVSGEDLPRELKEHLVYVMTQARDLTAQWDVQNEHIAMHYYEEKAQQENLTKDMFHWAYDMHDSGVLYLNEFQCVTSGAQTEQLHDLAKEYLDEGVPLQGLGIQGHTKAFVKPDPTSMWRRLDRLGELGLPLMMTEFDIAWPDVLERADWFEDAIRAFFGHPKLMGVILWGFWNNTIRYPDKELVTGLEGTPLTILESGARWACLVNNEWRTNVTLKPTSSTSSFKVRGFKGDYRVLVFRNGVPVQEELFTLDDSGDTWRVTVIDSTDAITVDRREVLVPECVSHRQQRFVGISAKSPSSSQSFACSTVSSGWSTSYVNANVSVGCPSGQVMTSCMSYQRDGMWYRNGEKIGMVPDTNSALCYAFNGHEGGTGVKAWAVCCNAPGLRCDYQTAGPSFPMDGAMAEATCGNGLVALGCSGYSYWPVADGVRPKDDLTACRAQSGAPLSSDPSKKSGSHVFSACCKADDALSCTVHVGNPSPDVSSVTCPPGTVLTGCNAFSEHGYAAGAKILDNGACVAKLGKTLPEGSNVVAYAICCSGDVTTSRDVFDVTTSHDADILMSSRVCMTSRISLLLVAFTLTSHFSIILDVVC